MASSRGLSEELSRAFVNFIQPIIAGIVGGALFSVALERTIRLFYTSPQPSFTDPEALTTIVLWISSIILLFPICWYFAKKVAVIIETFSFEIEPRSGLQITETCLSELEEIVKAQEETSAPRLLHTIVRLRGTVSTIDSLLRTGDMKKMWDQNKVKERENQLKVIFRDLEESRFQNDKVLSSAKQLIRWFQKLATLDELFLAAFKEALHKRLKNEAALNGIELEQKLNYVKVRKKKILFRSTQCVVFFDSKTAIDFQSPLECTAIYYAIEAKPRKFDFRDYVHVAINDAVMSEKLSPVHLRMKPRVIDLVHQIREKIIGE